MAGYLASRALFGGPLSCPGIRCVMGLEVRQFYELFICEAGTRPFRGASRRVADVDELIPRHSPDGRGFDRVPAGWAVE